MMHPWRGRSRPTQNHLPLTGPEAVLGERHPQMVACENFLGHPVKKFQAVRTDGPVAVRTAWARAWGRRMETVPRFVELLPAARRYLEGGHIWHLEVRRGEIHAILLGSQLYAQKITVRPLTREQEAVLIEACRGRVQDTPDLLAGKVPESAAFALTRPDGGLIPGAHLIEATCSCEEGRAGNLCRHSVAVMVAMAARIAEKPRALFALRGTDPEVLKGLLPAGLSTPPPAEVLLEAEVAQIFDLRLEQPRLPEVEEAPHQVVDPLAAFLGREENPQRESRRVPTPMPPAAVSEPVVGSWLEDDWGDDEEDDDLESEVFGGGSGPSPIQVATDADGEELLEIGRSDLIDLGIPSHRVQRWLTDGTLIRTPRRGRYQITPDAWSAIEPLLPSD